MPPQVTTRGLFWTGVWCVIAAVLASFVPALYPGNALGTTWLMLYSGLSTLLTVVRDFGVLAIVGSLVLQGLTSHHDVNHDETRARREL
ncbi:MAG: hypothetical protein GX421_11100 [Caldisericales bacterium]|nr:hypothetical protein [Caldisericales bacterium]